MPDSKPGSLAAGRARYLASRDRTADPAEQAGMTGVDRGRARYKASRGDGTARAALRADAEASTAARRSAFTPGGGDIA